MNGGGGKREKVLELVVVDSILGHMLKFAAQLQYVIVLVHRNKGAYFKLHDSAFQLFEAIEKVTEVCRIVKEVTTEFENTSTATALQ